MKNIGNYALERNIVMTKGEFEELMIDMFGSETAGVNVDFMPSDGVWVEIFQQHSFYDDDPETRDIEPDQIKSRLAEYFGVDKILRIRYDAEHEDVLASYEEH